MKIGIYTADEILEFMTEGEGRGFLGRSMFDAMYFEIERLNKKIEQYENPEDMTLMFMWCDEKAKDEIERLNNIINGINSILEYWACDEEQNDISSFRMAMKSIKDILGSDKE